MIDKIIIFLLGWLAGDVSTLIFLYRWAMKSKQDKIQTLIEQIEKEHKEKEK